MGWFSRKKETSPAVQKGVGKMNVIIPESVKETIAQRGIKPEDVTAVIEEAEATKKKLASKDGSKFLAKKKIGAAMIYADYSMAGNDATLNSAYSHRMEMGAVMNATKDAETSFSAVQGSPPLRTTGFFFFQEKTILRGSTPCFPEIPAAMMYSEAKRQCAV